MKHAPKYLSTAFTILLGFVPHTKQDEASRLYVRASVMMSAHIHQGQQQPLDFYGLNAIHSLRLFGSIFPGSLLNNEDKAQAFMEMHRCHTGMLHLNGSRMVSSAMPNIMPHLQDVSK